MYLADDISFLVLVIGVVDNIRNVLYVVSLFGLVWFGLF
jgi:hypothetical protein